MNELQVGVVFAERYRVVRPIAAGGMGAIYEAVHLETGRRRALKVMLPQIVQNAELRERFQREARVAASVESEFIVDVSDAGIDPASGMPFLVMELLRGEELGKRLARVGRLPAGEVVTLLRQVALALDKTHAASIVHRDLKPENLFLTETDEGQPRIKILDFGIAKIVAESATYANATRSMGTPFYMAPEQFLARPITGAADVYALGLLAYTFLVGAPYWAEEAHADSNVYAFGMIAVNGPKEPASARAARRRVVLPPGFDAWFARVTAVDPAARFPSGTLAVSALAETLGLAPRRDERSAMLPAPGEATPAGDEAPTLVLLPGQDPGKPIVPLGPGTPSQATPHAEPGAAGAAFGVTAVGKPRRPSAVLALAAVITVIALVGATLVVYLRHDRPRAMAVPHPTAIPTPETAAPNTATDVPPLPPTPSATDAPQEPPSAAPPPSASAPPSGAVALAPPSTSAPPSGAASLAPPSASAPPSGAASLAPPLASATPSGAAFLAPPSASAPPSGAASLAPPSASAPPSAPATQRPGSPPRIPSRPPVKQRTSFVRD